MEFTILMRIFHALCQVLNILIYWVLFLLDLQSTMLET